MTDDTARVLPLAGGCNFRDLGGYRTADGRTVRLGRLFRSGVLSYLTEEDAASLERLGVRVICDLRRPDERLREPTAWPHPVEILDWQDGPDVERAGGLDLEGIVSADDAQARIVDLYRAMPGWLSGRVAALLRRVASGDLPLVFHCAAGKDRTGFCAAIVLHCLGVPRETILADYDLTNSAVDLMAFVRRRYQATMGLTDSAHPLRSLNADVLRALLLADGAYLAAAFGRIETDHGSIDRYVRDAVGLDDDALDAIRQECLS